MSATSSRTSITEEDLRYEKIAPALGTLIQQGRMAKGLTQRDLAVKINEKQQIVRDYEAGRGVTNNGVLAKIERVIGLKLRGKEMGEPLEGKFAKKNSKK